MRLVTPEENRQEMLNILDSIDAICKHYNLKYWLSYGSLIGAVRHQGWIPWDDDIDICMPRKDYCFLLNNWKKINQNRDYVLIEQNFREGTFRKCKIANSKTSCTDWTGHNRAGIWVDIFPIDGVKNKKYFKVELMRIRVLMSIHTLLTTEYCGEGIKGKVKKLVLQCSKLSGREFVIKYIEETLCDKRSVERGKYLISPSSLNAKKECFERGIFEDLEYKKFENRYYMIPKQYDIILRAIYGNYMELPPVEQRTTHGLEIYWK